MPRVSRTRTGQTITEAILWLPLALFLIYGLLQACQLGIAMVAINYAASSVARQAARGSLTGVNVSQRVNDLSVVGMEEGGGDVCNAPADQVGSSNPIVGNRVAVVSAKLDAF